MPKFELILSRFRMGAEHLKVQTFFAKKEHKNMFPVRWQVSRNELLKMSLSYFDSMGMLTSTVKYMNGLCT